MGWKGICEMKNMQELDLSRNKLVGQFPLCLTGLTGLRVLDLSSNQLNGKLPSTLGNLGSLSCFFQLLKTRQFGYGELVLMSVFMSFIITTTVTFDTFLTQLKRTPFSVCSYSKTEHPILCFYYMVIINSMF
ncbi:receptor-like protein 15 [Raphanus sativus]|uniref:Receptor-like protein 15 n=1 Tax=Raphanus sativus TaxID=3726 RepID=A0A9W3CDX5_RAPSA|nr:receptor-like protein 15 [Raphanus sativus]XP_056849695.1 receptor-like protein 15 [Raphanus sativus]